jgi:hypothetical protein
MYSVSSGFTTQIGVDSGSNIYVSGDSKETSVDEWNGVIKTAVNSFIEKINKTMNYTGYSIPYISGLPTTLFTLWIYSILCLFLSQRGFAVKSSPVFNDYI